MKETNTSNGIGFCGVLTIVFIVLKLLDKIDWSWFWILSPIILPISIVISIMVIVFIFAIIKEL